MAYDAYTTADEVLQGVDLSGRFAVVTGGTTGIGFETCRALAAAGAEVLLTARSAERGQAAVDTIRAAVPDAKVACGLLELEDLDSVRTFAAGVLAHHDRIDLLVNNAGIMGGDLARTRQGYERQLGTNHLAHFLLANLLAPALIKAAPSRVVVLGSAGHHWSDVLWDDPNFERRAYDKWEAYGQSKTCNLLFALELDRRLAPHGVHAFAVHPGAVQTELSRHYVDGDVARLTELVSGMKEIIRKQPPAGAASTVWAATAPELDNHGGAYIEDCHVSGPGVVGTLVGYTPWGRDAAGAERLWTLSERLVGQTFPIPA